MPTANASAHILHPVGDLCLCGAERSRGVPMQQWSEVVRNANTHFDKDAHRCKKCADELMAMTLRKASALAKYVVCLPDDHQKRVMSVLMYDHCRVCYVELRSECASAASPGYCISCAPDQRED